MAFKNCFYLRFLKDVNPGIDFSEEDFNWQTGALKVDMYYGYEKADGSEPDWVKIGFDTDEVHHIDVTLGQKIYFKGTMPIAGVHRVGNYWRPHHEYKWFNLSSKSADTILYAGGNPTSMLFDGDGSPDLTFPGTIESYYPGFHSLCLGFPGRLSIEELIFPDNSDNSVCTFAGAFSNCGHIMDIPKYLFKKHKLTEQEYYAFFQQSKVHGIVYLPFSEEDSAYAAFGAMFYQGTVDAIHLNFSSWTDATNNWANGTTTTKGGQGKFFCPSALPVQYGSNRIPNGWVINPTRLSTSTTIKNKYRIGERNPY